MLKYTRLEKVSTIHLTLSRIIKIRFIFFNLNHFYDEIEIFCSSIIRNKTFCFISRKEKKKKLSVKNALKTHRFIFKTYSMHSFLRLYIIYNWIINKPRVSDTPLACIDFRCATLLVIFKRYVPAVINSIESMHSRNMIVAKTC